MARKPLKKQQENDNAAADAKPKKKRGPNWTSQEDEFLTRAWGSSTLNSIKGNYQEQEGYWEGIKQAYAELTKTLANLPERSLDSMTARWRLINHSCTKFNGVFVQVKRTLRSGWVEQNYLDEAQDIYKEEVGEPFSFYACWLYLKNHPKWALSLKRRNGRIFLKK